MAASGQWTDNQPSAGVLLKASAEELRKGHRQTSAMDPFPGPRCRYFPMKLTEHLHATTPKQPGLKAEIHL